MTVSLNLLVHNGPVDQKIIDQLLLSLKKNKEFKSLPRPTSKRMYSIVVECLDNIAKHSVKKITGGSKSQPFISVDILENSVIIKSGNPVYENKEGQMTRRLRKVNQMDEKALLALYEKVISKEAVSEENGAGLGFIIMKLRSGNTIEYSFSDIGKGILFFYIQVLVNKFIMRKLIIEQTASSPKVILDPERDLFEISGESRPPDVAKFYNEILNWFDDFTLYLSKSQENYKPVTFNLDLEYFNSSSAKYLLDFCKQIASVRSTGLNIAVNWHYEKDDIDMLEAGKEMSRIAKLPFEYVQSN